MATPSASSPCKRSSPPSRPPTRSASLVLTSSDSSKPPRSRTPGWATAAASPVAYLLRYRDEVDERARDAARELTEQARGLDLGCR